MGNLKISAILATSNTGNNEFSARKVRANQFGGLMDPIIGFDHFQLTNDVFGAHPHAGMSAISYLFDDSVPYHNLDSIGTNQVIMPGSMMWTWAGSGVVHTEFPVPNGGRVHGLQLFVNIPAKNKQRAAQSLYIDSTKIPELIEDGIRVRVVSGNTAEVINPVKTPDQLTFLHVFVSKGKTFQHSLPEGWTGTIYMINGSIDFENSVADKNLEAGNVVATGFSDQIEHLSFHAKNDSKFVFLSGPPLREEIFSSGAMSMSSPSELEKAVSDYKNGKMGFINVLGEERTIVLPV